MPQVKALAVSAPGALFQPFSLERRALGPADVRLDILYCGICHSDIHQARNEWGGSRYPMVPGHEILGRVAQVGTAVRRFKVDDVAGVGCFIDSCRRCAPCRASEQQFCEAGMVATYNSLGADDKTPTYGGYSGSIVVDEGYALHVDPGLRREAVAPLLCAGITTYSPLVRYAGRGPARVAIMGLGGLGHMAVKLAAAMGHEVCVLSTSRHKQADAKRLGAHDFALTHEKGAAAALRGRFDLILNTLSAPHDLNAALDHLAVHGTMVLLGAAPSELGLQAFALIGRGRRLAGSLIGGIDQTQAMLNFCAAKQITADVEVCTAQAVDQAYARVLKNDVKYRFVIDMSTL